MTITTTDRAPSLDIGDGRNHRAAFPPRNTVSQVMDGTARNITDKEFALFQKLIYAEAGIHLGPVKKALVSGRLCRRLRDLGLRTFSEYYERVLDLPDERV